MEHIGKLEKVDIRRVWPPETDFTKWLEQNPDLLGETLGLSVQSLTREQGVGDFFVDLVGEEESGGKLIVENQFGKSDHDHLGKVLTYLAAFEASVAVWIVETPRPEHVRAFAWLNDASSASFLLAQVQAVRIGDSPPAPLLTLIVGPGEARNRVSNIKKEMAESDRLRLQFWSELISKLKLRGDTLHAHLSPQASNWISAGAGISGLSFNYFLKDYGARVELYIDRYDTEEDNRKLFDLLEREKTSTEDNFQGTLHWQALEGKRAKRICWTTQSGGLKTPEKWPSLQDELIDAMQRLVSALKPHISKLNEA